jgi:NADH dehydrogenase
MGRASCPREVVIIGAGFAGLNAARALAQQRVRVTVIDRRNHHLFQPLLYQVATAALTPADIAYPIRSIFRKQKNARVLLGEALAIDKQARKVRLKDGNRLVVLIEWAWAYLAFQRSARLITGDVHPAAAREEGVATLRKPG